MKRYLILGIFILLAACEKDSNPVSPGDSDSAEIQIIIENNTAAKNSSDTSNAPEKADKPAVVDQCEVRVLKSDNSPHVSPVIINATDGRFVGTIKVKAEDNLKVLCIGSNNDVVERFGIDDDVDAKAGKTTTALITGWDTRYIPEITGISPNPSTDGSFTITWDTAPNATSYVLQEADNQQFGGVVASYSTPSLQLTLSGKVAGTYYYQVQSSNEYNIKSGWSVIDSAVVQNTHTISGTVSGVDGVTVTLIGDASEIQTVNDGEAYSFTVAEGGSYTVTPSKKGYSFTPFDQTFNNVTSSHTQNFSGDQDFYEISGSVTGADGVTVILGGDLSDSKTVDDGGTYSFTVGGGGNYTVTPFKTGYLFNPASSSFFEITSDRTQNFTGISSITHTISGTVTGADGVTITLGGDASGSQVVNDGDPYSFTVAEGGNYTITPSKTGYTFTPASRTFSNVTSNQTQNFTATVITYTISGTVSGADGVTVLLSGDDSGSLVVNDGGSYSFTVAEGGNYTITPTKTGYTFTPASQTFSNVTSNQTRNFIATVITYTISGTVSGADDVTVTLSGDKEQSLAVDDGGTYSFTVNHGGNYTVTPSKSGYIFTPASRTFNNVTSNQTQNFVGSVISPEITMVSIPSGTFRMGDISGDGDSDELPVHDVTISSFEMSIYEITQEQYETVTGSNPSNFIGTNWPVQNVSWYDAVQFCNAMSDAAGFTPCYDESSWSCDFSANGYRLPTEAEWEYACRAGTETKYYTGNNDSDLVTAGWYSENSGSRIHSVGQKTVNAYGLYDMQGNVWEWCNDRYGGDYYGWSPSDDPTGSSTGSPRVVRGGAWYVDARECRSANRDGDLPSGSYVCIGFRVVRRP